MYVNRPVGYPQLQRVPVQAQAYQQRMPVQAQAYQPPVAYQPSAYQPAAYQSAAYGYNASSAGPDAVANLKALATNVWNSLVGIAKSFFAAAQRALNG